MEHLRRHPVAIAAALAFLARLPALTRPVRADEAGFLLVARAWDPQPNMLSGCGPQARATSRKPASTARTGRVSAGSRARNATTTAIATG